MGGEWWFTSQNCGFNMTSHALTLFQHQKLGSCRITSEQNQPGSPARLSKQAVPMGLTKTRVEERIRSLRSIGPCHECGNRRTPWLTSFRWIFTDAHLRSIVSFCWAEEGLTQSELDFLPDPFAGQIERFHHVEHGSTWQSDPV